MSFLTMPITRGRTPLPPAPHFCEVCRQVIVGRRWRVARYSGSKPIDAAHVQIHCPRCRTFYYASGDATLLTPLCQWRERCALERRLIDGAVSRSDRLRLIAMPFYTLAYTHDLRIEYGKPAAVLTLAAVPMCIAIAMGIMFLVLDLTDTHNPTPPAPLSPTTIAAWGLAAAFTLLFVLLYRRRYRMAMSGWLANRLIRSLAPIGPTRRELEEVIDTLREDGIGTAIGMNPVALESLIAGLGTAADHSAAAYARVHRGRSSDGPVYGRGAGASG